MSSFHGVITYFFLLSPASKPRADRGWVLVASRGVEFIGVLRHMQRYFSNICDGTDVQAD